MTLKRRINTYDLSNKELSIQVDLSGLSFCILNRAEHKIEAVFHENFQESVTPDILEQKLKELFNEHPTIKLLRKLHLVHSNELSAFIPEALFNKDHLSDYLKFNVKILENDVVVFDEIPEAALVNVYVPFMNVTNYFFDLFGSFEYKHTASVLVEQLMRKVVRNDQPAMYADINTTRFEIMVIKNKKLIYYNSFFYDTPEDFIYYVLFAAEQLGMNPDLFSFEFLKSIDEEDMKYQYVYKYIRNVTISKHQFNFKTSEDVSSKDLNDAHLLISTF
ncbi:DUF3822 family protein [Ascidiimonas sp. W6]|uniref:DUF3822 family protein n=1 Tax=Ascidiimonas meishanensis TaxID=3128903 RepID=UPI0030EB809A